MRWRALALTLLLAAGAPALARPGSDLAPAGLAALEGRGPGAPGSAAEELAASGAALRFAAPAGGATQLVLYLAAMPGEGRLELRGSSAFASLLGVPGEVRLADTVSRRPRERPSLDAEALQQVPEPGALLLTGLGLGVLARLARRRPSCHPARRWSGPPPG